jgi:hypothetical protein
MMTPQELMFPILTISQGTLLAIPSAESLMTATRHAIKRGYFDDLWLVDSASKSYRVHSCETVEEPLWRRIKTLIGGEVRIEKFNTSYLGIASVDDVRARCIAAIEADDTWNAGWDVSELIAVVRGSQTVADVIRAVGGLSLGGANPFRSGVVGNEG